jgi:hypothetical protein
MKEAIAVVNIAFIGIISYWLWKKERHRLRKCFWPALILKCAAGIGLGLVYTYYYAVGDTFNYFQDGNRIADLARVDIGAYLKFLWDGDESYSITSELIYRQPRAMFLSKVTSIFCLLTFGNYWVISLYFSTACFITAWTLVRKIAAMYSPAVMPAVISFLFFPSVVFWSSGIIKESIALGCLFYLTYIFLKIFNRESLSVSHWVMTAFFTWLLWNLKYYYLAVFLPVTFTTLTIQFLLSKITIRSLGVKIMLWLMVFMVPLLAVSMLHPNFYPQRFMEVVVSSYNEYNAISDPDDLIHYHWLKATPLSLLRNAPWALVSGLYRPFLTEANSFLQMCISVENLILAILTIAASLNIRKMVRNKYRLLLVSVLIYTILLCIFLALSTPNFGTLSRYRVGFLPFFMLLLTIDNPLINNLMTVKLFRKVVP